MLECYIFRVPIVKQDLFDKINLFIKKILLDNRYPEDIVLQHISKKITRFFTAKPFGPEKRPVNLRAPWIGSASQQLEHQVKSAVQNCYEAVSPHLIFSSQCMLPAAKKDVLPTNQRSVVIYEYVCHGDSQCVGPHYSKASGTHPATCSKSNKAQNHSYSGTGNPPISTNQNPAK